MNLHKYSVLQSSPIFTTRDFAIQTNTSISASARLLNTIAKRKEINSVVRGLWTFTQNQEVHPFSFVYYPEAVIRFS